ncbi:hypothetical protein [Phaeacidiphilus oryzae]|uniref:hypothetical protein n=1 Tax=Phaeacidiphilus oryzae TaxID=348818 RepID=UPI00068C60A2|nr:hypothetical protein [Phaeacidiphilus oryzae]
MLLLLAGSFPRLALLLTWLFTTRVHLAFHDSLLIPLAGLVFLPLTTLMYALAYSPLFGVTGWGWVFVLLGLLVDVSSWGAGARRRSS